MRLRTNAKTNLFLRVRGRRPDGYHEIETIFHTLSLADELIITPEAKGGVEIEMHPKHLAGMPSAERNLVHAAAQSLIEAGAREQPVRIGITKRIPIGAGLGGGSGNAAAALVVLNELWGLDLDSNGLARLARELGADVPFCLTGGTALATGRGEVITSLPAPAPLSFVLGLSDEPLSTRDVYEAFDVDRDASDVTSAPLALALGLGETDEIANHLHNDLESSAMRLRPELVKLKQVMVDAGALGAIMSGSGPTLVGIARDQEHAAAVAEAVEAFFDRVVVTTSAPECIERLD
jgi:4-diphosphocytidyl-2-C-methyl-D-erythritol kinase